MPFFACSVRPGTKVAPPTGILKSIWNRQKYRLQPSPAGRPHRLSEGPLNWWTSGRNGARGSIPMLEPISCTTQSPQSRHTKTHAQILKGLPSRKKDPRGSNSTRDASSIRSTTRGAFWDAPAGTAAVPPTNSKTRRPILSCSRAVKRF